MKRILSFILSAMLLTSGMMFTAGAAEGDTEITALTTAPTRMWGVTEGTVAAPEAVATETDIDGVTLTPVWAGADGFEFGGTAEGGTVIAYTATYTAPEGYVFAESFEEGENVTVSDDGKTLTYKFYTYVIPADALYVDDAGRTTENYGEGNLAAPYPSIEYAMEILEGKGGGTIVVLDTADLTTTYSNKTGTYTIVGWNSESAVNLTTYSLYANLVIRDVTLNMNKSNGGIYGNGYSLTLGDRNYSDLNVTGTDSARQLMFTSDGTSGKERDITANNPKFTVNSGDFAILYGSGYGSSGTIIKGDINYEINGGTIKTVRGGFICGTKTLDNTLTGDVNIVVNGGTITDLYVASSGARYIHNGNGNITVNGGTIGNIYATTKTSTTYDEITYTPIQNGDTTIKINGGTITGKITNTPTEQINGTTVVDIIDYNGDITALAEKITASQFDVVKSTIIYVDSTNGASSNDGLTPETALPTMTAALAKFANGVSGKIFVCGEYDTATGFTDKSGRGEVIISGYNGGKILINHSISLSGDTIIDNIVLEQATASKSIFAFGHKLVMGENITVPKGAGGYPQLEGGGNSGKTVASTNMTINGGTYGLVHSGADYNGGTITGDAILTINGGTFTANVYSGSFVRTTAAITSDTKLGEIGGKAGLYINGGTFEKDVYLGGYSYATTGSLETKITDGTFAGNIVVGPQYANGSYTYTPTDGSDPTTRDNCVTDILGDSILEISGGTFSGKISCTDDGETKKIVGKSVVILSNGTAATVTPAGFDYVVKASKKGTVSYDAENDKFSIVPSNSAYAISVNETEITKNEDNIYTLSGDENNVYNIVFGGESDIAESFIITAPIPGLTPVSNIVLAGGKKTWNPLISCTASDVTWEPADSKFQYDTKYTATVVLTAKDGIEYSDDFSGLNINGNYEGNTVKCTLSEDATQITVKVTFPKTPKTELELLAESKTPVSVSFTTSRSANPNSSFLKGTRITFTNINDDTLSQTVEATENGNEGTYSGEIVSGLYNVSVKKQGYIEQIKEAVYIEGTSAVAIDFGALTAGDIIDSEDATAGNGKIDIDDFVRVIRGFNKPEGGSAEYDKYAAAVDLDEDGIITVKDLSYVKDNFANTTADTTDYDGYFENTYYRLTVDKKLTVGYIGGSIIQGASIDGTRVYEAGTPVLAGNEKFIDRMQANFEKHFPDAEIHSINAGVSDTGSTFALYRLRSDLMLRDEGYIPDLVFLEFCVNDTGSMGEDYLQSIYEGVIREVYSINPKADIVCVLTAMSGYEVPKKAQTAVANHYNLPIADVGKPMYDQYTISGDCKVYTDDNLHPNNAGYEYYTKICYDLLEKYLVTAAPSNPTYSTKVLPEIFAKYPLINPQVIAMNDTAKFTLGTDATNEDGTPAAHQWTLGLSSKQMTRAFDASSKQMPCLASAQVGDWFEFSFEGTGFSVILKQHPNMGSFEYMVDNSGEWIEYKMKNTYVHFPAYPVNLKLPEGKHTVRIRVSGKPVGTSADSSATDYCEVGIAGILCSSAE